MYVVYSQFYILCGSWSIFHYSMQSMVKFLLELKRYQVYEKKIFFFPSKKTIRNVNSYGIKRKSNEQVV